MRRRSRIKGHTSCMTTLTRPPSRTHVVLRSVDPSVLVSVFEEEQCPSEILSGLIPELTFGFPKETGYGQWWRETHPEDVCVSDPCHYYWRKIMYYYSVLVKTRSLDSWRGLVQTQCIDDGKTFYQVIRGDPSDVWRSRTSYTCYNCYPRPSFTTSNTIIYLLCYY